VHLEQRTVMVFSSGTPERTLTIADVLDGGEVAPESTLPLADMFRR
jgi:hypothetical protein